MSLILPSLRSMRLNIWRAIISATDQEIRDGMDFYPGAHGLCRAISAVSLGRVSTRNVAGIYAALSPMNGWYTNVANTLDIIRDGSKAKVNTSHVNRLKAVKISIGIDPLIVLRGEKVRAFFKSIADPTDTTHIPVDRHLICLALGNKLSKNELSRAASNKHLYYRVEKVYRELGEREKVGNRLASIAWFVQRRVENEGRQELIPHPSSPMCCGRMMSSNGRIDSRAGRRWYCFGCRSSRMDQSKKPTPIGYIDGYSIFRGKNNGRKYVTLYVGHPYANRSGWQYLSRYLVMRETGEVLRSDEHVDHIDRDKTNDQLDLSNYRVVLAEYHGRYHATHTCLRDGRGRFTEIVEPETYHVPRFGPVIGTAALSL